MHTSTKIYNFTYNPQRLQNVSNSSDLPQGVDIKNAWIINWVKISVLKIVDFIKLVVL